MQFPSLRIGSIVLACCVSLSHATAARADEVLDQEHDFTSSIGDTANQFSQSIGQTFTVGVAGTLTRIEVKLARIGAAFDNVVLTVFDTSSGLPDTPRGSAGVIGSSVSANAPTFISFDISSFAIPVAIDDLMAFSINSDGGTIYVVPYEPDNQYPDGSGVWRVNSVPPGDWQFQGMGKDYGFRTYVDAEVSELIGDYNGDGKVSAADYTVWRDSLGAPTIANRDPENTGAVDGDDFESWKEHYGEGDFGSGAGSASMSNSASVPEPSAISTLVFLAFSALLRRARNR